jgi:hypothetical protein
LFKGLDPVVFRKRSKHDNFLARLIIMIISIWNKCKITCIMQNCYKFWNFINIIHNFPNFKPLEFKVIFANLNKTFCHEQTFEHWSVEWKTFANWYFVNSWLAPKNMVCNLHYLLASKWSYNFGNLILNKCSMYFTWKLNSYNPLMSKNQVYICQASLD